MQDYAQVTNQAPALPVTATKKSSVFSQVGPKIKGAASKVTHGVQILWRKKIISSVVMVVIVAAAVVGGFRMLLVRLRPPTSTVMGTTSPEVKTVAVNRDFEFSAYNSDKKIAKDKVKYAVTDTQLTNQIIIKGQSATAVAGRLFLIINLKLVNDSDDSLFLNSRNYIRVQPLGSNDKLAPEIHNDTVEVQPLSTKLTRVGLPVDMGITEFKLFVGELEGDKEEIDIKF